MQHNTAKMVTYKYAPLPPFAGMVRLLRLFKGFPTEPIRCEVFETNLHENGIVTYEALSYTWGSTTLPDSIKIQDIVEGSTVVESELRISTNLHTALRYLRTETKDRILWIDAVCIDQSNRREKGHQIEQMRSIYENAHQVLIWLGQSNERIDIIMDSMDRLHNEASENHAQWANPAKQLEIAGQIFRQHQVDTAGSLFQKQLDALEDLFSRSWFRRVWVIQEIVSARAASVLCGSKSAPAAMLALMPSLVGMDVEDHLQAILDVLPGKSRKTSWWAHRRDLHFLLKKFSACQASEPQDKVYALLGISSDARDPGIFPPDYSKTMDEVCRDTFCFLLFKKVLSPSSIKLPKSQLSDLISYLDDSYGLAILALNWTIAQNADTSSIRILELGHRMPDNTFFGLLDGGGHNILLKHLLSNRAIDYSKTNKSGEAALNIAARKGNEEFVSLLIEHPQVDVDHSDADGITALEAAAIRGHISVVKLLLDQRPNVDINHKDVDLVAPLSAAVIHGHLPIVELLLAQEGIDSRAYCPRGASLMSVASILGYSSIVHALSAHSNLPVNQAEHIPKGRQGVAVNRMLLAIMARDDNKAGVAHLLEIGVHPHKEDDNGLTPFARAAMTGAVSTMEKLHEFVQYHAFFDIAYCRDSRGRTPLDLAAARGQYDAYKTLSILGGNVYPTYPSGNSEWDLA